MTAWTIRRPPRPDQEIARWTLDRPPALEIVRAGLHRAVGASALEITVDRNDLTERLMIAATELPGNAPRHSQPPSVVLLLRADGHLILDVIDNVPTTRPTIDADRPPGTGGLGLPLTQRRAQDVGWHPPGPAKHAWAQFPITTD